MKMENKLASDGLISECKSNYNQTMLIQLTVEMHGCFLRHSVYFKTDVEERERGCPHQASVTAGVECCCRSLRARCIRAPSRSLEPVSHLATAASTSFRPQPAVGTFLLTAPITKVDNDAVTAVETTLYRHNGGKMKCPLQLMSASVLSGD